MGKKRKDPLLPLALNSGDITKSLDMSLDKNDLVAYRVAQIEEELEAKCGELKEEITYLQRNRTKLNEKYEEEVISVTKSKTKVKVKALEAVLNTISRKLKVDATGSVITDKKEKRLVTVLLVIHGESGSGEHFHINYGSVGYPVSLSSLDKEIATNDKLLAISVEKLGKVKEKLSKIDSLERKARASLVENILSRSDQTASVLNDVK